MKFRGFTVMFEAPVIKTTKHSASKAAEQRINLKIFREGEEEGSERRLGADIHLNPQTD
jgi:hypothetical protein